MIDQNKRLPVTRGQTLAGRSLSPGRPCVRETFINNRLGVSLALRPDV